MAVEKLQILLDADWRGKSEVQQADKDINRLDDSVGKVESSWGKLAIGATAAVGAIAAVGAASKVAYDTLKEGAAINQAAGQFDRLTESIGSSADVMLGRLREGSLNMVSDANLVSAANELLLGKITKTEDATVRLASATGALGLDMGILAQTINNQSVLRLDNLGVAVEDVIPRFNELKQAGVEVKEAFTLALTEALEKNVALLGESSETTAGQIQQLETAVQNARDALTAGFAAGAAEEVALLAANVDITTESFERAGQAWGNLAGFLAVNTFGVTVAQAELDRALKVGIISANEYRIATANLNSSVTSVGSTLEFVAEKQELFDLKTRASVSGLGDLVAVASSADAVMLQYSSAARTAASANVTLGNSAYTAVGGVEALKEAIGTGGGLSFVQSRDLPRVLSATQAQIDAGGRWAAAEQKNKEAARLATAKAYYSIRNDGLKLIESYEEIGTTVDNEMRLKHNEAFRDMRREGLDLVKTYQEASTVTEDLSSNIGRVGGSARSAADEMAALARETGNFFDQARRSEDFDPAEAFYQSALSAGASAEQLRQLLVGTGLETPERAQEIYNQSIQRQLASQAGEAFAQGGNLDMLWQGVQAGVANPELAARQVSNVTNVGGVSVSVVINGNVTGEELDMFVDNALDSASKQRGDTEGG